MTLRSPPNSFHDGSDTFQGEAKGGALAGFRLDRDRAAMPLDDLLADGKADPGAGELIPLVQPLEHAKDPVEILRVDSKTVVLDGEAPHLLARPDGRDMDLWAVPGSGI